MIRDKDNCYLVEGYTDVISLHQAGIENTVASSGTSLTTEQIRLIRRFTENITVLYDGDNAGIKASLRGTDLILEEGLNVKVVVFPDGEDPDSYLKKIGPTAFEKYIQEQAADFITFKAKLFQQEAKNDPVKRAEMIREVVSSIMKIPDVIKQRVFFQECSHLMGIEEQILIDEGRKISLKNSGKNTQKLSLQESTQTNTPENQTALESEEQIVDSPVHTMERETIRLLLNYAEEDLKEKGKLADFLLKEISDIEFDHPLYKQILNDYRKSVKKGKVLKIAHFIKNPDSDIKNLAIDLISNRYSISELWETKHLIQTKRESEMLENVVLENIFRLKLFQVQAMIQVNTLKLEKAESAKEEDKFLMIALKLEKLRKELALQLNNVVLKI